MAPQYLRRASLSVEGAGSAINLISSDKGDEDQLRVVFRVEQNNRATPNVLNVFVYNLKDETVHAIRKEYKRVTLSAGYRGSERIIFKGEIIQVRDGRENVTDKYMHILATSGERAINHAVVNKSLAAGYTFRDQVDVATKAMQKFGIKIGHVANLGSKKFSRGCVLHGQAKDLLRQICQSVGGTWSIQNDTFQLEKLKEPVPGAAIVLNSDTGLVGLPAQTIQGIEGQCLLNPLIVPGSLIKIDQRSVQRAAISPAFAQGARNETFPNIAADGLYKIFVVGHEGDLHGNTFYTTFIGIRQGDPVSAALANLGYGVLEQEPMQ